MPASSSDFTRMNRAKVLATSARVTPPNRTGDYLAEKRFGSARIYEDGVIIKEC